MKKNKIIIIGGGIGGLMCAIALNKKGIENIIYERTTSFDPVGAGLAVWGNATSILDKFGLLEKLIQLGSTLNELKSTTSSGKFLNIVRIKKLESKFHFPSLVLLRSDLQGTLLNAVPNSQIIFNKQCIKVEKGIKEVKLFFKDGSAEIADAVIFADGIHSIARDSIFNFPVLKYTGRTSWRGVAELKTNYFKGDQSFEIFGKGKRMGIFPLPNNLAYWYGAVNMNIDESNKQRANYDSVASHFKDWAEPVQTILKCTPENKLVLTPLHFTSQITNLVKGNIALLGDAAHPMTPDLGQGACQAIEDAFILTECMIENISITEAFKNYEAKRLKRVRSIAKNSYRMGNLRQMQNPIGLAMRNTIFKIMPEKFALNMLERTLKMNY